MGEVSNCRIPGHCYDHVAASCLVLNVSQGPQSTFESYWGEGETRLCYGSRKCEVRGRGLGKNNIIGKKWWGGGGL